MRFGTGCGTRPRGVVSVIKSDVQSPLCQASLEMVSEGRLELPAFAFVARCDDPISLLRRWGVLRELNSELQSHILPCCRYTKDAIERIENGGSGATRTPNGLPRTCIRDRPTNQLSHASMKWRSERDSHPQEVALHRFSKPAP